mmetsp:Transcript_3240/g.4110  ORF Transcript_3240/g.4110 Transcript_3240/m.4110 type:complete len:95 (-) Transcript_3240:352-636(-)
MKLVELSIISVIEFLRSFYDKLHRDDPLLIDNIMIMQMIFSVKLRYLYDIQAPKMARFSSQIRVCVIITNKVYECRCQGNSNNKSRRLAFAEWF